MIKRLMLLADDTFNVVAWMDFLLGGTRGLYVSPAHVMHVEETRLREDPYADLDEFGRKYVRQLQRRLKRGKPAWEDAKPLVETRPQLLYYRDALIKRKTA